MARVTLKKKPKDWKSYDPRELRDKLKKPKDWDTRKKNIVRHGTKKIVKSNIVKGASRTGIGGASPGAYARRKQVTEITGDSSDRGNIVKPQRVEGGKTGLDPKYDDVYLRRKRLKREDKSIKREKRKKQVGN